MENSQLYYPKNQYENYHAHLYFNQESVAQATELCQLITEQFKLSVGRIHTKPIGPHTQWSCQITFSKQEFNAFIPWLDKHRHGLSVLVHALTNDNLKDHTDHAYWLGTPILLNTAIFQ